MLLTARTHRVEAVGSPIKNRKPVSTIPDECKGVGLEIGTNPKRKAIRKNRRYGQCHWQQWIKRVGLQMVGTLTV